MNAWQILELLVGEKRFYDGAWHVFDEQGNELTAPSGVLFRALPGALLWQRVEEAEQEFRSTTYNPGAKGKKKRRRKSEGRHDAYPFAPRMAPAAGDALEGESRDFWLRAFGVVPEVVEPQEASQPDLQAEQRPSMPADEVARGDEAAQAPGFEINGDTFAQAREAIERIREQSILAGRPDAGRVAPSEQISDDEDEAAILALLACYME